MSKFTIKLHSSGRCHIRHEYADADIITDLPPEYGGSGQSFSSTDLVSAALGTCTLTSIDKILKREGYDPKLLKIEVTKELSQSPKKIKSIRMKIIHPKKFNGDLIKKIKKASVACPVKRSLNQDIHVQTEFLTE
jgi:uncharacterized OsmC-like protein